MYYDSYNDDGVRTTVNKEVKGILIKDFINKHLKIEEELQNRIDELEAELQRINGISEEDNHLKILFNEINKISSIQQPILISILLDTINKYKTSICNDAVINTVSEGLLNMLDETINNTYKTLKPDWFKNIDDNSSWFDP